MGAKFRQPPFSVAEANIISKSIMANGTYNASSDSADGYNPVTVNVPGANIISKSITANGTYNASSDSADGYNPVTVNVPESVIVSKSITANGTYNASSDNANGYNPVTVDVVNSYNAVKIETCSIGGYDASLNITIGHVTENVFYADQSPITLLYTEVQSGSRDFADVVKIQYRNEWQIISLNNASYEYVRYNSNVTIKSWLYNVTNTMIVTE